VSFGVSRRRLLELLPALSGRQILVAGDFVLDRFVYGHPKRISREAPVLILRFWKEENLPGGAGNTAANVTALGGVPRLFGAIGEDEEGRMLREALRARGVEASGLTAVPGYRTPTKTRVLGGAPHAIKQQIVRFDREEPLPDSAVRDGARRDALAAAAAGADAAVLSDYGYGAISPDGVPVLRGALRAGAPVLLDCRFRLEQYRGVDAATPNEEELEAVAGAPFGESREALDAAAAKLRGLIGCRTLLVTRGSRGMALYDANAPAQMIPVHGTDQVADVTGAGDTVLATFSLALAAGASALEAALLANFAGGVVVMKMGTAVVTPEELRAAIEADKTILRES
jgi:rfaE bifunctional protein kinase chain/domain